MDDVFVLDALRPLALEVERVGGGEQKQACADLGRGCAANDVEGAFVGLEVVLAVVGVQLVAIHEVFKVNVAPGFCPVGVAVVVDFVRFDEGFGGFDFAIAAEVDHVPVLFLGDGLDADFVRGGRADAQRANGGGLAQSTSRQD